MGKFSPVFYRTLSPLGPLPKSKKSSFLEYFTVSNRTFLTPFNLNFAEGVVNHFWIARVKFQVNAVIFLSDTSKKRIKNPVFRVLHCIKQRFMTSCSTEN